MSHRTFRLTRDLTPVEREGAEPGVALGSIVHRFWGATYGSISPGCVAVTFDPDGAGPFFEVPLDAVEVDE